MFEGSRAFDIGWGLATGSFCFALGIALVYRWVRARADGRVSIFGAATDPRHRLELGWAVAALAMGGTNFGCRFIDHRYLAGVHEGFFALTIVVSAILLPRFAALGGSRGGDAYAAATTTGTAPTALTPR